MINVSAHPRARRLRAAALVVAAAGLTLAGTTTASAHVHVSPETAEPGGYAALTFRVPNEDDDAGTTKVEVTLPTDTPLLSVSTKPVPGWKATVADAALPAPVQNEGTTVTRAPRTVTWTAQGDTRIRPGEYQEFSISAGPLPESGELLLPATQTYSDGTVVRWNEPTPANGDEPEHPAPTVRIEAAQAPGTSSGAPQAAATTAADPVARGLGGAALVLGLAGLVVGLLRRGRTR